MSDADARVETCETVSLFDVFLLFKVFNFYRLSKNFSFTNLHAFLGIRCFGCFLRFTMVFSACIPLSNKRQSWGLLINFNLLFLYFIFICIPKLLDLTFFLIWNFCFIFIIDFGSDSLYTFFWCFEFAIWHHSHHFFYLIFTSFHKTIRFGQFLFFISILNDHIILLS